ncbi:Myb/SANT-like domain-containing protein [Dioscorea alata]|uniref:Myb/SANT-like domain-containing protein n=1 Tax=Dioscorea alata TaxID=55571 RepID=A0ACB7WQ88_DIOAL|nr:Myb/SANT-like domain-containing protein [Dioscorea alata]
MVSQVIQSQSIPNKGLKCDKSFKRVVFSHEASAVNEKFGTDFTTENVENHYRTLKARYVEIKKATELSGAGWDDENKMITFDPIVAYTYTEAYPAAKPFINKPIDNYEGLKIICGDDNATGSYATSLYSDSGEKYGSEDNENYNNESPTDQPNSEGDGDGNSAPHVPSSPASSSMFRVQWAKRGNNNSMMCPTPWAEILYGKVKELEGFNEQSLKDVFDHLHEKENEGRRFLVKRIEMRQAWVERFLNRDG